MDIVCLLFVAVTFVVHVLFKPCYEKTYLFDFPIYKAITKMLGQLKRLLVATGLKLHI